MTYDHELKLIDVTYTDNSMGDIIPLRTERIILCDIQSIARSEHYSAATHGLKPEIVFIVNKYDYLNEKEISFEGKDYRVIRTYTPKKSKTLSDFEAIELICEGVANANA